MTLFNPESLNPARWFTHLLIIIGLHQAGALHSQGYYTDPSEVMSNRTGLDNVLFSLPRPPLICPFQIMTNNGSILLAAKISDTFNYVEKRSGYCSVEISCSPYFWIVAKSSSHLFRHQIFNPELISEKQLGYHFFSQALAERTFEKGKIEEESLIAKSKQSLLESWLFKCLVLATLVFISYVLCRIEVNRRVMFAKVSEKIVRDLHNDIGSNASAISVLAGVTEITLENSEDVENARNLVRKIRSLSEKVMDTTEEVMWSIALKNNSLEEVSKRMRLLGSRLEDGGVNFIFNMEGNLPNHMFDLETRNHIYIIFKEILMNIAKHANCKNAKAKLSFKEFIELVVIDDGIGFNVDTTKRGNGLHIIRSRSKHLNANLSITSKIGRGTTIKVIFPN